MKSIKDGLPNLDDIQARASKATREPTEKQLPISRDLFDRDLIARNEFNLEKWSSFIFPHARTKDLDKARTLTYKLKNEEGIEDERAITVAPRVGKKSFTNRTYTTLLALIVLWHMRPTQDGKFKHHYSDVCRVKGISPSSGKNLSNIYHDLYCLATTSMDFHSSFFNEYGEPDDLENVQIVHGFGVRKKCKETGG